MEALLRNHNPNMAQSEHVYAICWREEVGDDVISSQNAKTIEGYVVINFEVASSSSFHDKKTHKKSFHNGGGQRQ